MGDRARGALNFATKEIPVLAPETSQSIEQAVTALLAQGLNTYLGTLAAPLAEPPVAQLEIPRNPEHGDWASSVALRLAKPLKTNPMAVAEAIVAAMPASELIDPPTVLKPGFINLRLAVGAVRRLIEQILARGAAFGSSDAFAGKKILVEFVSANPPVRCTSATGAVR